MKKSIFVVIMKKQNSFLIISISSIALLIVLIIQVNWILETARIKEEMFNEKANMVLSRTTEALCEDKETCMRIGSCIEMEEDKTYTANLGANDIRKIDSLFNYYMKYYNLHIDYEYVFEKEDSRAKETKNALMSNVFYKQMDEMTNLNGLDLKLILPDKKQYIIAEMGSMFLTSVILILVVIALFWRTVLSLLKEKRIADHTVDFLNNMTHEFKTPLTNIALAGKMILKESDLKEESKFKHYSEIILAENDKLRNQVEQVLGMTALERDDLPMRKESLNLHDLLNDILKCMSVQFEENNVQLNVNFQATSLQIKADKAHLSNAICNLIDNAIKYSKDNLSLKISTFNQGDSIALLIEDTGIGIQKDHLKLIFDKYYRISTGDIHNVKGFGLGLTYVKKIIDLHMGQIQVRSDIGVGTQFMITLPNE